MIEITDGHAPDVSEHVLQMGRGNLREMPSSVVQKELVRPCRTRAVDAEKERVEISVAIDIEEAHAK